MRVKSRNTDARCRKLKTKHSKMIHYLTVQDMLWINQEVSNQVNSFKHLQLEEGTYYQYGYGKSENVLEQAGNFIQGFIRLRPFDTGNRATAFVACLAFLEINGYVINLEESNALKWALDIADKKISGVEAVSKIASPGGSTELNPAIRVHVKKIIERYSSAIQSLTD